MGVETRQSAVIECGTNYVVSFECRDSCVRVATEDIYEGKLITFCEMLPSEARKLAKALERLADDAESD